MATRRNADKTNKTNKTTATPTNGEPEMTATPETIVDPENVEHNTDNSEQDNSTDDTNTEPEVSEAKFQIPADLNELDLGDEMATLAGKRYALLVRKITGIDETLRAQNEKDSEGAVILAAESDSASETLKTLLSNYRRVQEELTKALAELADGVRAEKGDTTLSEDDITKLKNSREDAAKTAKNARVFLDDMTNNNELPTVANFLEALPIPGARKSGARSNSGGTGSYQGTTSARPRIGAEGFIAIGDQKFKKFTDAVRHFRSAGKAITTGEIHTAWANAASSTIDKWQEFPTDTEFTLNGVDVAIHFVPDK